MPRAPSRSATGRRCICLAAKSRDGIYWARGGPPPGSRSRPGQGIMMLWNRYDHVSISQVSLRARQCYWGTTGRISVRVFYIKVTAPLHLCFYRSRALCITVVSAYALPYTSSTATLRVAPLPSFASHSFLNHKFHLSRPLQFILRIRITFHHLDSIRLPRRRCLRLGVIRLIRSIWQRMCSDNTP